MITGLSCNITLAEGLSVIAVFGVDEAGNVDPVGASQTLIVDTSPPMTAWVQPPPPLVNHSSIFATVQALGEREGGVSGFDVFIQPLALVHNATSQADAGNSSEFAVQYAWQAHEFVPRPANGSSVLPLTLSGFASGAYNVSVYARDDVDNRDRVGVWAVFVVDLLPPVSRISLPLAGRSTFNVFGGNYINSSALLVSLLAADTQSLVLVQFELDGSGIWSTVELAYHAGTAGNVTQSGTSAPASGQAVLHGLSDGLHTVRVRSVDAAGNAEVGPFQAVEVVVDTHVPVVALLSAPPPFTNSSSAQVCVAISDSSPLLLYGMLLNVAGTPSGAVTIPPGSACAVGTPAAEGLHTLVLWAVDAAGGVSVAANASWVYGVTPPVHSVQLFDCVSGHSVLRLACRSRSLLRAQLVCDAELGQGTATGSSLPVGAGIIRAPCSLQWRVAVIPFEFEQTSCSLEFPSASSESTGTQASAWVSALVNSTTVLPDAALLFGPQAGNGSSHSDGHFVLQTRSVDAAGNIGPAQLADWWVDSAPPAAPATVALERTETQDVMLATKRAHLVAEGAPDTSPGSTTFWYTLNFGTGTQSALMAFTQPVQRNTTTRLLHASLTLPNCPLDAVLHVRVWTQSQAGLFSATFAQYSFIILSTPPQPVIASSPARYASSSTAAFVFVAAWPANSSLVGTSMEAASLVVTLDSEAPVLLNTTSHASGCNFTTAAVTCAFSRELAKPGQHTLQVYVQMHNRRSNVVAALWAYVVCLPRQEYAVLDALGNTRCVGCEEGKDCAVPTRPVVARGYWSSPHSGSYAQGVFYRCPLNGACRGGMDSSGLCASLASPDSSSSSNASALSTLACVAGYQGLLCTACSDEYFMQFGACHKCPATRTAALGAVVAAGVLLLAVVWGLYRLRNVLPVVQLKVGVSMLQILAASNSAYDIPWPPTFTALLNYVKIVMVDLMGIIPAACTTPMTYYSSLTVTLVLFKLVLFLLLCGPWLWFRATATGMWSARPCRVCAAGCMCALRRLSCSRWGRVLAQSKASSKRRSAAQMGWPVQAVAVQSLRQTLAQVDLGKVFKLSFMYLYFCYPGITLMLLRVFKCHEVEGVWYLLADMRLRCYTPEWSAFVAYSSIMLVLFTFGLPVAILRILYTRRHKLFGPESEATRLSWGFLYEAYGAKTRYWEVMELVRKLFLCSFVVLFDARQPLQVALAVLVSFASHSLHGLLGPWGEGTQTYRLQHLALTSTSFVFLVGLLFKSKKMSTTSVIGVVFSGIMLLLQSVFFVCWVWAMVRQVVVGYKAERKSRAQALSGVVQEEGQGRSPNQAGTCHQELLAIQNPLRLAYSRGSIAGLSEAEDASFGIAASGALGLVGVSRGDRVKSITGTMAKQQATSPGQSRGSVSSLNMGVSSRKRTCSAAATIVCVSPMPVLLPSAADSEVIEGSRADELMAIARSDSEFSRFIAAAEGASREQVLSYLDTLSLRLPIAGSKHHHERDGVRPQPLVSQPEDVGDDAV